MTLQQQITPYVVPKKMLDEFLLNWEDLHYLETFKRYHCSDKPCYNHYQRIRDIFECRSRKRRTYIFQEFRNTHIKVGDEITQYTIIPRIKGITTQDLIILLNDVDNGIDTAFSILHIDVISETQLGLHLSLINIFAI